MKYFVENRITAYVIFISLFIFGVIGFVKLPVSLMPQTAYPGISIIIEYAGISPEKIETLITKPVEKIVKTVPGIESIDSVSEEGKSRINITFDVETNIKIAALKVREKIGLIRSYFPRAMQEPVVIRYDPSDKPVVIAVVEGIDKAGASLIEIRDFAERKIKPKLQRIEGVSEINIAGGLQREIHIDIDQAKLESLAISFNNILQVVQNSNISLPGGLLSAANKEYVVYTPSKYKKISEIADTTVLLGDKGNLIKVYDFAGVLDSYRDREDIARLDGSEKVTIYIQKAGDANILEVCNRAVNLLNGIKNCRTRIVYNQGSHIKTAVNNVVSSCLWGMVIVVLTIYIIYRRFPLVLAISLSIPFSLIAVFAAMYFAHIDIDVMSLSGLALGGGIVVDNSIIVTESICSRRLINKDTIIEGSSFIKNAVLASTLANIIVFFPIAFGDVMTRRMYGGMAFAISTAVVVSLAIALILVPALYMEFSLRDAGKTPKGKPCLKRRGSKFFLYDIAKSLKYYRDKSFALFDKTEALAIRKYGRILDHSFTKRKKIYAVIAILFFIALTLSTLIRSEYLDPMGTGEFYVYLEFPTGTSLGATNEAVMLSEDYLKSLNITEKISAKVEKWRGTLSVKLNDSFSSNKKTDAAKKTIKTGLDAILKKSGAFAFISEADEISARELNISFLGDDNEILKSLGRTAAGKINGIPGIEECVLRFREGKPALWLNVDRDKAVSSGLSQYDIADFFHNAVFGPVITKFIDEDREIDVRLRYLKDQRDSIQKILSYSIRNEKGDMIPAKGVVTLQDSIDPTKIWRQDGRRSVKITVRTGKLSFDEAVKKIDPVLKGIKFPPEYTYEYDESFRKMKKNQTAMILLICLAILFVYMVLAILFESLLLPLIIITSVPLAFTGVILTLFMTMSSFNISIYIGLIILTGTVVNNGIVLVEAIRLTIEKKKSGTGMNAIKETIKGVSLKYFRPVLIITLTKIMGLMPVLVSTGEGSNLWRPLSLTIISGLAFSTMLTLVLMPVLYYSVYSGLKRV